VICTKVKVIKSRCCAHISFKINTSLIQKVRAPRGGAHSLRISGLYCIITSGTERRGRVVTLLCNREVPLYRLIFSWFSSVSAGRGP
jgi:hypothetical protein